MRDLAYALTTPICSCPENGLGGGVECGQQENGDPCEVAVHHLVRLSWH